MFLPVPNGSASERGPLGACCRAVLCLDGVLVDGRIDSHSGLAVADLGESRMAAPPTSW